MSNANYREMFKNAISDALSQKYDEELAASAESAVCSQEHYDRMAKIVGISTGAKQPRRRLKLSKRAIIAFILSIIIFLTSCTAYIFRNEFADFFEDIYHSFINISFKSDVKDNTEFTEYYTLTYVPDGYKLNESICDVDNIRYKYLNSEDDIIIFSQIFLSDPFYIDSIKGTTSIFEFENYTVYHRIFDCSSLYLCKYGEYAIYFYTSNHLDIKEIEQMIDNLKLDNLK